MITTNMPAISHKMSARRDGRLEGNYAMTRTVQHAGARHRNRDISDLHRHKHHRQPVSCAGSAPWSNFAGGRVSIEEWSPSIKR